MSSSSEKEVANNSRTIHRRGARGWARKALSVVLATALCVTMCPISAYADDEVESAAVEQEAIVPAPAVPAQDELVPAVPASDETASATPALDELAASMPQASPREVVQFANEWLATHVAFDPKAESVLAASDRLAVVEQLLETGAGDAAAFAFAFQALMDQADIPSICVQNEADTQVWNMVELDGEWLHVDAAKNAQAYAACEEADVETHTCFTAYLLVSDEVLAAETEDAAAFAYRAVEGFELPEPAPSDGEEQGEEVETPAVKDETPTEVPDIPEANVPDENVPEIITPEEEQPADEPVVDEPLVSEPADEPADAVENPSVEMVPNEELSDLSTGLVLGDPFGIMTHAASGWTWPLPGYSYVSQGFGGSNNHEAIDIPAPEGTPVVAARAGTVVAINMHSSYGNAIAILHDGGYSTFYCHLSRRAVSVGAYVNAGQTIGYVGHTGTVYGNPGNHLHFRLNTNATKTNYWGKMQNPANYVSYNSTPPHSHSYSVASCTYYHSSTHRVIYNKCSCGASKADTFANHDFQWCGLTNKCTVCGAVYDKDTYMTEYFTNQQTTLYEKAGYNQKALLTIPKGVVVKPLETPRDYAAGRFQMYIEYKGKRGYVWSSDVTPNSNGGVHTWKNGKCATCGIAQAPSQPGVYKITADKTIYKDNALRGAQKKLKAGDTLVVTKVETTTAGYLWGWTADGYTLEMTYANMKYASSPARNGTVTTIPEGIYVIRSAANRYYGLDIYGASTANGANLQLWQDNGHNAQKFKFTKNSDGTYLITNIHSGKALDVANWGTARGVNIGQWDATNNANQRWYVEKTKSGTYSLRNKHSNLYMDVYNGEVKNNGNIWQYDGNGSLAQQFYIEQANKGSLASSPTNTVVVTGVNSQYTYTGKVIAPAAKVRKQVYSANQLRAPVSGTPNYQYAFRDDTVELKAGKTYVLEIGSIIHNTGSGTKVSVIPYNFTQDTAVGPMMTFAYSSSKQTKTFTPTADCRLLFYSGVAGACNGNVSTFNNIRVYEVLKAGTDYKTTFTNNVNAGKATVRIQGLGNYSDVFTRTFAIKAKAATPKVTLSTSKYTYDGKAKKPGVTVKVGSTTLKSGRDYTVSYSNNVKVGTGKVKVTLKGNYTGSATKSFTIADRVPKAPASKTGWVKSSTGRWYYYQSGKLSKGWKSVSGAWYYLDPNTGVMQTGWKKVASRWYYLKSSGAMAQGWIKDGRIWYYLNYGSGALATGWIKDAGKWYFADSSGAMKTGWIKVKGAWYYLNASGVMQTGWFKVGSTWYYANSSGVMLTNRWIGGTYWVGSNGAMAKNAWVDGGRYWVGADGRWRG